MLDAFVVHVLWRQVALCHVVVSQPNVNHFVLKRTRSQGRRRHRGRPCTLTAPGWCLRPGRRAASRAESRARVPASSLMLSMMVRLRNMAPPDVVESPTTVHTGGRIVILRSSLVRLSTGSSHAGGELPDMSSDRCTPFGGVLPIESSGRRTEIGTQSTTPGARHSGRCDLGPAPKDAPSVDRHSVSVVQSTSSSASFTLISFSVWHSRNGFSSLDFGGRRPSDMKHYLPQPIRYRRPPFLLRVHPGASAVPSIALACREYAPMTQATSFPPSSLQTWQHVADVVGRLHGSHRIGADSAPCDPWRMY